MTIIIKKFYNKNLIEVANNNFMQKKETIETEMVQILNCNIKNYYSHQNKNDYD